MNLCPRCNRPAFATGAKLCAACRERLTPKRLPYRPLNDRERAVIGVLADGLIRASADIAAVLGLRSVDAAGLCVSLRRVGLIAEVASSCSATHWKVTPAGILLHVERLATEGATTDEQGAAQAADDALAAHDIKAA